MDNFTKTNNTKNPISLQCANKTKMILYTPFVTGGNTPNNVKSILYSQYVKQYTKT